MVLDKYIRDLLYLEDCVIIPGLGAFVSHYISAEIQEDTQTILPPAKEIAFNSELLEDDGILVSYMSDKLDRPEDVIREMIADQVKEIHEALVRGRVVNIGSVGHLSSGLGGELVFKASSDINFLMDSFGFSPFSFPALEPEKHNRFRRSIFFRQPVSHTKGALPGSFKKSTKKDNTTWQVVIAISILFLFSLLPYNSRISESIISHPAALGSLPSLVILDPPLALIDSNIQDDIPLMRYPIIAGSFLSFRNADILYQKLISRGYNAKIEQDNKSFYRVIMAEFITLDKAELALLDLQAGNKDLTLWILK